jgi:hypothetical protein
MIKFENCSIGSVHAITLEAGASAVIHIGGSNDSAAYRSRSESGNKKRCPLKVTTTQRTEWATIMSNRGNTACPEGWETETFFSPKAFADGRIPQGLAVGDAIFFWKSGCTAQSCPQGFEAVYLSVDSSAIMVIVPASTSEEAGVDEEDSDLEEGTPEEEVAIPPAPEIEAVFSTSVGESELEEEN